MRYRQSLSGWLASGQPARVLHLQFCICICICIRLCLCICLCICICQVTDDIVRTFMTPRKLNLER